MDDEFKQAMHKHMALQTEFVGDIRRVALVYEQNAKAVRTVFRFLAWLIGIAASVLGVLDFLRAHK